MGIKLAVAARPEIGVRPVQRNGLVVIVPYATGDMAGREEETEGEETELRLERPGIEEFEKALMSIGVDEAIAKRIVLGTGRSWSVFRRRHAINPAIRRPPWLNVRESLCLSILCLFGAWSSGNGTDRSLVARLSARAYEEIERDLRYLATLDDAPVVQIGQVWKAKAPLELLELFGERITPDEIDRFFLIAGEILAASDPMLELPQSERHAAAIYRKIRPESEILLHSVCDALIKFSVRSEKLPALSTLHLEQRIAVLVRTLLKDADETRWLSLSPLLPSLAEAAPNEFLRAVEKSLSSSAQSVTQLFGESGTAAVLGRCWHAGLLWALETLAWKPDRLARVAIVLARLSLIRMTGNWANSPLSSLVNIFRSWLPQTAASVDQRIAVLDTLLARDPEIGFDLLDSLVDVRTTFAMPSARPKWRDDDAGAGYAASQMEYDAMRVAAADRLIHCSRGRVDRIARVIDKISVFDQERVDATLALADAIARSSASDEDKEIVRNSLRTKIYWHRNFDKTEQRVLEEKMRPIEDIYKRLSPVDIIVRNRWLFQDGRPDLPFRLDENRGRGRRDLVETLRLRALREIFAERGWEGVEELSAAAQNGGFVAHALAGMSIDSIVIAEWIAVRGGDFEIGAPLTATISGFFHAVDRELSSEILRTVLGHARVWSAAKIARLLLLARSERSTWTIAAELGPEVDAIYWAEVTQICIAA